MRIFAKPFFTNYIVHPLSKDLTRGERAKALISSIAIGIFSLGICQAVCAIKFHNRRTQQYKSKVIVYCPTKDFEKAARKFLKHHCPRDYRLEIEFTSDHQYAAQNNKRVLGVYTFLGGATEQDLYGTGLGYATQPGAHRKIMVLVNHTLRNSPVIRGPGWDKQTLVYLDSRSNDEIKDFFAPIPDENLEGMQILDDESRGDAEED
jgi:hypothetical protein